MAIPRGKLGILFGRLGARLAGATDGADLRRPPYADRRQKMALPSMSSIRSVIPCSERKSTMALAQGSRS